MRRDHVCPFVGTQESWHVVLDGTKDKARKGGKMSILVEGKSVTFDFDLVSFVETPGVLPFGNFQVSGWMAICDRLL